jgi:hypothetical protein
MGCWKSFWDFLTDFPPSYKKKGIPERLSSSKEKIYERG